VNKGIKGETKGIETKAMMEIGEIAHKMDITMTEIKKVEKDKGRENIVNVYLVLFRFTRKSEIKLSISKRIKENKRTERIQYWATRR
jgi:hypothetical protein